MVHASVEDKIPMDISRESTGIFEAKNTKRWMGLEERFIWKVLVEWVNVIKKHNGRCQ